MKHEPLEIKNAILKELKLQIITDAKGRRFPHPGLEVQLLAPVDAEQNKYLAHFGENRLQNEIHGFLQEPTCARAVPFVEISFFEQTEDAEMSKKGYLLRYVAKSPAADTKIYLEVLNGVANCKSLCLVHPITFIGRCQNVLNKQGNIDRINDLYFPDVREMEGEIPPKLQKAEKINNSVSRIHAHIKAVSGSYFLFDDDSARGTSILPGGRGASKTVDKNSGIKLENNDIISFGKAVVKVKLFKKS
jgi:hypothetical protein